MKDSCKSAPRISTWIAWAGLALLGVVVVNVLYDNRIAQGEIRETPRPEAFLSGGARSEIVLREIAETLKRIDGRLERFEQALREPEGAEREPATRDAEERNTGRNAPETAPPEQRKR